MKRKSTIKAPMTAAGDQQTASMQPQETERRLSRTLIVEDRFRTRHRSTESIFTGEDKDKLNRRLEALHKTLHVNWTWWADGIESTCMLANSPADIQEKVLGYLGAINIMSGLVLSSIAAVAFEQIVVEEIPDEMAFGGLASKQVLAVIYNVLAL